MPMASPLSSLDLSQYRLRACIDFVTIATPGKVYLPPLLGKACWGIAARHRELTIHDPQWMDLGAIASKLPGAALLDLEIAIDFYVVEARSADDRDRRLSDCFTHVAGHLYPYAAPFMNAAKTRAYNPATRRIRPFNRRLPDSTHQLLFGLRNDGPVQVKCYYKRRDQGLPVAPEEHRIRVEVR